MMTMHSGPATQADKQIPLNRIRVETALSRFPIHRLAKKGNVSIDLQRLSQNGEADFKWEVTYNVKHGQPGPLAYKLDTLIVYRRIDQVSRPLPEIIKLGSLSTICADLGLGDSGNNIGDVKRALHQNASAYITAKIRYKQKNGRERWGEIGYTLTRRGITEKKATELLDSLASGQEVMDQIEWTDSIIAKAPPGKFHNPPGLYVATIRDNVTPPATFLSSRTRRLRQEAQQAKDAELARHAQQELAYAEYQSQAIESYIAEVPRPEYQQLLLEARRQFKRTYTVMSEAQLEELAANWVRAEVKNSGRVRVMGFEEFCDRGSSRPTLHSVAAAAPSR